MNELVNRIGGALLIQVTIDLWNSLFLFTIFFMVLSSFRKEKEQRHIREPVPLTTELLILCVFVFMYNIFDALSLLFNGYPDQSGRIFKHLGEYGYFATGVSLILFLMDTIRKTIVQCRKSKAANCAIIALQTLQIINIGLLVTNPFLKKLFIIDECNRYSRVLPGYYVWSGINIFTLIAAGVICACFFKTMDKFQRKITAASVGITLIGAILNLNFTLISLHCISVSLITVYLFMVYSQNRTEIIADNTYRIEKLRTGLVLSQISPHFIHNSITAIIYYADKDTEKTRSALISFSKYLRKNLDFVNINNMTTIEEEIEHAKIYLSLEELRFGDDLKVDFDLNTESFRLPVLTVQPLVENAVKHGIKNSDKGCGTINVRTEENGGDYIITITDNGAGFDTDSLGSIDSTHTGIRSVRSRLKLFCNGSLTVESSPGKGTVCRITIPRSEDQNENTDN